MLDAPLARLSFTKAPPIARKVDLPELGEGKTHHQMIEHANVRVGISVTTLVCQEWSTVHAFQESYKKWMPEFRGFSVSVHCFLEFPSLVTCYLRFIERLCKDVSVGFCMKVCRAHINCNCEAVGVMVTISFARTAGKNAFTDRFFFVFVFLSSG